MQVDKLDADTKDYTMLKPSTAVLLGGCCHRQVYGRSFSLLGQNEHKFKPSGGLDIL